MSCDTLGIDDQATGYIVLESEKVTLAGFMVVSRRYILQDLCKWHLREALSLECPFLALLLAPNVENFTGTTIPYCEQRYHLEFAHTRIRLTL